FTAGRASSFFDFYAHDFEIQAGTLGSDVASTNLAAYTATLGNGFSATVSMEDPSFRRTPVYSPANVAAATSVLGNSSLQTFAVTQAPAPVFLGFNGVGAPVGLGFEDVIQRNRMPDFVGVLRYDQPWGSAQISGAVHEVNIGTLNTAAAQIVGANPGTLGRTASEYGWAVQGGLKINLPFIAPGDTLYLQGAYAEGAGMYSGVSAWAGSYIQSATSLQGAPFQQFFSDAVLNPLNNRLELTQTFSVVASLLHYWNPTLRSALFGSYGEVAFAPGARAAQASYNGLGIAGITNIGAFGSSYYNLNQILRDTYAFNVGGSLIWSPVKDLDIGVEGVYQNYGVQSGRVIDANRSPGVTSQTLLNAAVAAGTLRTVTNADVFQVRARVQRDF
ncbi:porin, partial [Methylobacterium gregans]